MLMQEVNSLALPHAASLRSHAFTTEETKSVEAGILDVVTGFQVRSNGRRAYCCDVIIADVYRHLFKFRVNY